MMEMRTGFQLLQNSIVVPGDANKGIEIRNRFSGIAKFIEVVGGDANNGLKSPENFTKRSYGTNAPHHFPFYPRIVPTERRRYETGNLQNQFTGLPESNRI